MKKATVQRLQKIADAKRAKMYAAIEACEKADRELDAAIEELERPTPEQQAAEDEARRKAVAEMEEHFEAWIDDKH
jgi:hypothetical protein